MQTANQANVARVPWWRTPQCRTWAIVAASLVGVAAVVGVAGATIAFMSSGSGSSGSPSPAPPSSPQSPVASPIQSSTATSSTAASSAAAEFDTPAPLTSGGSFLPSSRFKHANRADPLAARDAWCLDKATAREQYGDIADWDISNVDDLTLVFCAFDSNSSSGDSNSSSGDSDDGYSTYDSDSDRGSDSGSDSGDDNDSAALDCNTHCRSFNDALRWDTSHVTTMKGMFFDAAFFNQSLSTFHTSSVTNMGFMFHRASSFDQPLSFDTSRVTEMDGMFRDASSFNQPLTFDTSQVWGMGEMFLGASSFDQSLRSFNVSSITTVAGIFDDAHSFSDCYKREFAVKFAAIPRNVDGCDSGGGDACREWRSLCPEVCPAENLASNTSNGCLMVTHRNFSNSWLCRLTGTEASNSPYNSPYNLTVWEGLGDDRIMDVCTRDCCWAGYTRSPMHVVIGECCSFFEVNADYLGQQCAQYASLCEQNPAMCTSICTPTN